MAIKKRSTCICQHTELRTVGLCWSKVLLPKYPCRWQQCNRRHQTSPTVCDPTPSRPLKDSSNACNQASAPIVCMPLCGPVQFAIHRVLGLLGTCFPPKCPFPFGDRHPHVTHCSWGQAHSQSQTASRSVQAFLYVSKCYAVQCIVNGEENRKISPSPWDFITLPEED